jgi:hypothetical protein
MGNYMDFENRYYLTDTMLKEYIRRVKCSTYFLLGIILALGAAARIIIGIVKDNYDSMVIFVLAFVAALFVAFFTPEIMFKEVKNNDKLRKRDGTRPQTVVKFSDKIYIKEGSETKEYEFSQVIRLKNLKNSYLLMTSKKDAIIIDREGFARHGFDEFKEYIKDMCPGVKEA